MEFGNPIVGQEELIREAIKSRNFTTDPETGVSGWRIARDGSATFYNLTVGSDSYFIDENGNAVFATMSADSINLDGESLSDILDSRPRGPVSVTEIDGDSSTTGAGLTPPNPALFARAILPDPDITRMYRVTFRVRYQPANDPDYIGIACYYKWDSAADITDGTFLFREQRAGRDPSGTGDYTGASHVFSLSADNGSTLHLAFYVYASASGTYVVDDARNQIVIEDVGEKIDFSTYSNATTDDPTQQYVKTYSANGSTSHQSDGDNRNIVECYQGYYSSTNGNQWAIITFPYATIQSDLSGATVDKVELYLNNEHWYYNSGGTVVIGTHEYSVTTGPSNLADLNTDRDRHSFGYGQAKWVTLPNAIGEDFRDDNARGIVLGPGPSTSRDYYGYFAGNGQTGEPKIRITYTK